MSDIVKRKPLPPPKSASELLDMYFLDIRCALLETASAFDRIERAKDADRVGDDPRLEKLMEACDLIRNTKGDRAGRFLELFSEPKI